MGYKNGSGSSFFYNLINCLNNAQGMHIQL